jgi:ABC-type transport system involved in cytochrome bd biosynthesis fused ATPase/permease subunit
MKQKINLQQVLIFIIVGGGLIDITESFLMSLGILLLLFVIDYAIADYFDTKKRKREQQQRETERQQKK